MLGEHYRELGRHDFAALLYYRTIEGCLARRLEGRAAATVKAKRGQLEAYEDFAAELGHEPGDVALAWLLHQPAVTAPIIGPRTAEQLESAIRALTLRLDKDALSRLDKIFPGHRPAPEDYAW